MNAPPHKAVLGSQYQVHPHKQLVLPSKIMHRIYFISYTRKSLIVKDVIPATYSLFSLDPDSPLFLIWQSPVLPLAAA